MEDAEDGQEECEFGSHAEVEPTMPRNVDSESDGGEDGERARLLSKPRTPWKPHAVQGVLNIDIRCIQGTMINFRLCALTMAI